MMAEYRNVPKKFVQDLVNGKNRFRCLFCDKILSTKRRVLGHIAATHKVTEQTIPGSKEECFHKLENSDGSQFQCKICSKILSSKQRIYQHLCKVHGKSPISKVYSLYKTDPSLPIPGRTVRRLQKEEDDQHSEKSNCEYSEDVMEMDGNISGIECLESSDEDAVLENVLLGNKNDQVESTLHESSKNIGSNGDSDSQDLNYELYRPMDNNDSKDSDSSDNVPSLCGSPTGSYFSDCENLLYDLNSSSDDDVLSSETTSEDDEIKGGKLNEPYSEEESLAFCTSAYVARYKLSGDAAKNLEKLVNLHAGCNSSTKVKQIGESTAYKCVSYCSVCFAVFEGENYVCETDRCGNYRYKGGLASQTAFNRQPKTSFTIADIASQLKLILEKKNIWKSIQELKKKSRAPHEAIFSDFIDGEYYRSLCSPGEFLFNTNNLSAMFNTDGVPLYSSSNVKLWPIFLAVNELPVQTRFSRENIVLAGIWQGKDKPPFFQYLKSFGETMCQLKNHGFSIKPVDFEEAIHVRLAVLCGTVDLQAKAYVLNMTMFNGSYGCSTCEEEGVVERQGAGYARYYPHRDNLTRPPLRRSDDVKYTKGPRAKKNKRIMGICGTSGLSVMPWFDVVIGMVPDYMHGALMGVTKKLLYLWFSPTCSGKSYFVGNSLKIVSKRLQNVYPPDYVERLPRDIEKHYCNFKATELQTWLLYYSIPCLKNILPDEYLAHLCLLSEGVYLLLGDRILEEELSRAESLLDKFYKQFPDLYNKGSCGLNFHNVGAHYAFYVRQWGPLWCWSCFPFEDANAAVLSSVHGTGDVTCQCVKVKELQLKLKNIELDRMRNEKEKKFFGKMIESGRSWKMTVMKNCKVTGRHQVISQCRDIEKILEGTNASSLAELRKVHRVHVNGEKLYCKEYCRMKKRICYIMCTKNGDIISVEYFVLNMKGEIVYAFGTLLKPSENSILNGESGRHIVHVNRTDERMIILVDEIQEKLFYMEIDNNIFIARMPNLFGHCVFK